MNTRQRNTPTHLNCQHLPTYTTRNSRLKYYQTRPHSILKTIHTPHTLHTITTSLHQTPPPHPDTIRQWTHQHNEWKQAGKTNPHTATPQQLQANAEHYKPENTT